MWKTQPSPRLLCLDVLDHHRGMSGEGKNKPWELVRLLLVRHSESILRTFCCPFGWTGLHILKSPPAILKSEEKENLSWTLRNLPTVLPKKSLAVSRLVGGLCTVSPTSPGSLFDAFYASVSTTGWWFKPWMVFNHIWGWSFFLGTG